MNTIFRLLFDLCLLAAVAASQLWAMNSSGYSNDQSAITAGGGSRSSGSYKMVADAFSVRPKTRR